MEYRRIQPVRSYRSQKRIIDSMVPLEVVGQVREVTGVKKSRVGSSAEGFGVKCIMADFRRSKLSSEQGPLSSEEHREARSQIVQIP